MKAIKREFLKPLDHTEDFKEKCREVIKYLEDAIAHADEECPYESEYCINQAFMGIRLARQIVDTVSDYYQLTTPYEKKNTNEDEAVQVSK